MDVKDKLVTLEELGEAYQQSTATLNAARLNSSADKTTHTINIPNNSAHFLIICSTSYGIHGYGIVASTSSGAVNAESLRVAGITATEGSGALTLDIGSIARPMAVIDINIRGAGYCTLS